jgi:hypothetical protein
VEFFSRVFADGVTFQHDPDHLLTSDTQSKHNVLWGHQTTTILHLDQRRVDGWSHFIVANMLYTYGTGELESA